MSASCLAAPLDPCQFRKLVVAGINGQLAALCQFESVDVVGGMVHLGGGLYQPSHPGATDDRWFVSGLGHERLVELLSDCPLTVATGDAFSVLVRPDSELGRCSIRVRCERRDAASHLDELALWATSRALVDELTRAPVDGHVSRSNSDLR